MKKLAIVLATLAFATGAFAQTVSVLPTGLVPESFEPFRAVSTAATAQIVTFDLTNLHDTLAIHAVCSAGTATLVVDASVDNTNFLTLDSVAAASPQIKQYVNSTVGAAIALSPLSFRYVRVTIGTCGASNTSTLTVSAK